MKLHLILDNSQQRASFDDFYTLYPRREAKQAAIKAWGKLPESSRMLAIEAIPNHVQQWAKEGRQRQFIPLPASWLNGGRYEDELESGLPEAKPCEWAGCKGHGVEQRGSRMYCDSHILALKRGETPGGLR
jgi:hypothetical protein